ncbi:hypothetical protein ABBQ38_004205 [Trebouxia sp. C0009 RCD-2024]
MCQKCWRDTTLDHFSWAPPPEGRTTYKQRYFVCDKFWHKGGSSGGNKGPIFFYLGNEADVTLYLNNTGLMWESAEEFGALLVFAEHRYYGESNPYSGSKLQRNMQYLTAEQAMADYAELLRELKSQLKAEDSAVIGFGGSYGGMLAAWMRMKYPHVLAGSVAASAPIWAFPGEDPPVDPGAFAKIVTRDATPAGGAPQACAGNLRKAWQQLNDWGDSEKGRGQIRKAMQLCPAANLTSSDEGYELAQWAQNAFDYLAMGDFPYPSGYMLNGQGELPAYPMRTACQPLSKEGLTGPALLEGLREAVGTFYNFSGQLHCYNYSEGPNPETDDDSNFWDYQACTEMVMPFSRNGVDDMFWQQPWDLKAFAQQCKKEWGVTPRPYWAQDNWGGRKIGTASNIVFSNGLLDPWHGFGVLEDVSDSVVAVVIPEGAHHLDLMFSNPLDPPSVTEARNLERQHMHRWVDEATTLTELHADH